MKRLLLKCKCGNLFECFASHNKKYCTYECFMMHKRGRTRNTDYFSNINSDDKAYWLGFLYADGNVTAVTRKQKSVNLELSSADSSHVIRFADIFGVKVHYYKNGSSCKCTVTSESMWNDLVSHGVVPNKTYIWTENIAAIMRGEFGIPFIRGFFDGDGGLSFNKKSGGVSAHFCGNETFLLLVRDILVKNCGIGEGNLFPRKNSVAWTLSWSGSEQVTNMLGCLYANHNICLDRKYKQYLSIQHRKRFRGVSKMGDKYMASIYNNGKQQYLGTFVNIDDAARAYDDALIKFGKPKYRLNFTDRSTL